MTRTYIINHLIEKYNYKSYLEVGVQNMNNNFNQIRCKDKTGVDPEPLTVWKTPKRIIKYTKKENDKYFAADNLYLMTSDRFFSQDSRKYDIIFIDGLHYADQVYKDLKNALESLNPGGRIVVDDLNPGNKEMQKVPRMTKQWTGDCWMGWVEFRIDYDFQAFVIPPGVGVINPSKRKEYFFISLDINYNNFDKNRKEWLNIITVDEFFNEKLNSKPFEF